LRKICWHLRATGTIQPVAAVTIAVPQLYDAGELVLTRIAASGTRVQKGGVVVEFDRTKVLDKARDAQANYEDLLHQVEQRKAQQRSDEEQRASDLQQAEADLAKARLELRKGPLLSEIDRLEVESKIEIATAHVLSVQKSGISYDVSDAADLKVIELRCDRQKIAMERARRNADRLQLRAPFAGMIVQEVILRQSQPGHPQEGDRLWAGEALARIFASTAMEVLASVAELDGAMVAPGTRAEVRLDSYPDLVFPARFDTASPVAAAFGEGNVKTFSARFRLESKDRHLLPDFSAAVDVERCTAGPVLAVPRAAVRYRSGKPYVILKSGGQREIELGPAFNEAFLEIASGLAAGDELRE
jgi:HlyD family secretion protein